MSETCETVVIVTDDTENGGYCVINKSDFDTSKHKLYKSAPEQRSPFATSTRDELRAYLDANSIKYDARYGDERLRELCEEHGK